MGVSIINKDVSVISSILSRPKASISTVFGVGGWSGGDDVTPNAVNWTDITGEGVGTTNTQTISGINTSIILRVEYTGNTSITGNLANVSVNGTEYQMDSDLENNGFYIFTVNNGDSIFFRFISFFGIITPQTVTIKNSSDSNSILDTFTVQLSGDGGGG